MYTTNKAYAAEVKKYRKEFRLEACPHCGSVPKYVPLGGIVNGFKIECPCGVTMGNFDTQVKARLAWNRRVNF